MLCVLVVVKTLNLEISRCHLADSDNWRIMLKCVPHAQHDYFSSFNQSDHFFLELLLLLPSSLLKLSIENGTKRLCKTAKWFQMSIQADKNGATWSKPRSISVNLHRFLFSPLFFFKGSQFKTLWEGTNSKQNKTKVKRYRKSGIAEKWAGFSTTLFVKPWMICRHLSCSLPDGVHLYKASFHNHGERWRLWIRPVILRKIQPFFTFRKVRNFRTTLCTNASDNSSSMNKGMVALSH